ATQSAFGYGAACKSDKYRNESDSASALHLLPVSDWLSLRSVNSPRSAYACIIFSSMFFQHYSCKNTPELGLNKNHIRPTCKLAIKAVLPLFRSLITLERNVEKCSIYTNFNNYHIIFQLFCKHGMLVNGM
uniref:Uncharacterized protein n=1 Tax=Varanus komodoensis TaxID=61221 RepID=A0A8D2Q6P1_VARKO